jgi:hypothetical protein
MKLPGYFFYIAFGILMISWFIFLFKEHKENQRRLKLLSQIPEPLPYYHSLVTSKKVMSRKIIRPLRKRKANRKNKFDYSLFTSDFDPAISTQIQKVNSIKEMKDE